MNEPMYLVVVVNRGTDKENLMYCGDSEVMAFKRLKELQYVNKEVVRATIKMTTMFGYELIESYEVVEQIVYR